MLDNPRKVAYPVVAVNAIIENTRAMGKKLRRGAPNDNACLFAIDLEEFNRERRQVETDRIRAAMRGDCASFRAP